MKELIIKKIVQVVWPWVVKNIWPIVQQYLIKLCAEGIAWLVQSIKDILKERSKQRADEANFNAKEAESKASKSEADSKEYHAYKAEAEVWRKVAEQYEKDIEEVKSKVSNLEAESTHTYDL